MLPAEGLPGDGFGRQGGAQRVAGDGNQPKDVTERRFSDCLGQVGDDDEETDVGGSVGQTIGTDGVEPWEWVISIGEASGAQSILKDQPGGRRTYRPESNADLLVGFTSEAIEQAFAGLEMAPHADQREHGDPGVVGMPGHGTGNLEIGIFLVVDQGGYADNPPVVWATESIQLSTCGDTHSGPCSPIGRLVLTAD